MAVTNPQIRLKTVPRSIGAAEIIRIVQEDGGIIIEDYLNHDQLARFNDEIEPAMQKIQAGSTHDDEFIADFHGNQTKRVTNLVTHSKTFRDEILDDDLAHEIAEGFFREESGDYWMNTAQVIEIGPGNKAQILHRDLQNNPPYIRMGATGPEAMINFLIGCTDFTDENGATRVIPGSNSWPDFNDKGTPEMTIPAEMKAGSAILISGKTVHGGGANRSQGLRRGVAFTFQPGFLTPEEAYPFLVDLSVVKQMSKRAQKMIGFRSQYPINCAGLWQTDYNEIGKFLGLGA